MSITTKPELLTPTNCQLIFIDHQPQMAFGVQSIDRQVLKNNTVALAKAAKVFNIPVTITTVETESFSGHTYPELLGVFPDQPILERTSMNSWDDQKVRDSLAKNGQKKVIVSGLWTEVCNNSFAFSAMAEGGYEIFMVADASGGTTKEAHDYSMLRMIQAGVVPVTWQQVMLEWQRDWAHRDTYDAVMNIVREHSGAYGMGVDYAYTMVHKAPERVKHGTRLDPVAAGRRDGRPSNPMTAPNRRDVITGATALGLTALMGTPAMGQTANPDLILINGKFTTLDRSNPAPQAVAITNGRFSAVGDAGGIMATKGPGTTVIDLGGRRAIPGLCDNHIHVIRGGLNFNMELRWDGVASLADAMDMLRTPSGEHAAAPMGPRGGRLHRAPVRREAPADAGGDQPGRPRYARVHPPPLRPGIAERGGASGHRLHQGHQDPPGGIIERDAQGNPTGLLIASPNAAILYSTLAKGPKLPFEYQLNSTRHFMRDLNRLCVTSVIDAGGGYQNYPEDYEVIDRLHKDGQLTLRIAYNLFTQKPKEEKEDFLRWTSQSRYQQGDDYFRLNGAGEMLVYSAADFEDFRVERPDMPPEMEGELEPVVAHPGRRTAGPGGCTRPMTRRSRAPSTCSRK